MNVAYLFNLYCIHMHSLNQGADKTQTDTDIPLLGVFIHHHREGGVVTSNIVLLAILVEKVGNIFEEGAPEIICSTRSEKKPPHFFQGSSRSTD